MNEPKNKGGRPRKPAHLKHVRCELYLEPEILARVERLVLMSQDTLDGNVSPFLRRCIKAALPLLEAKFGAAKIVLPSEGAE